MMISAQEALQAATAFAEQILEPNRRVNLLLEELERSTVDGRDVWLVTLSMSRPAPIPAAGTLAAALGMEPRDYKRFVVDAQTGEVLAMRIRDAAA